jgi:hypothetical protein
MNAESTFSTPPRGTCSDSITEQPELTEQSYAGGESEVVMGQAIRRYGWKRNDIVISTKVSRYIESWEASLTR